MISQNRFKISIKTDLTYQHAVSTILLQISYPFHRFFYTYIFLLIVSYNYFVSEEKIFSTMVSLQNSVILDTVKKLIEINTPPEEEEGLAQDVWIKFLMTCSH